MGTRTRIVLRSFLNGGLRVLALAIPAYAYWSSSRPHRYGVSDQVAVRIPPGARPARPIPAFRHGVLVLSYHDLAARSHNRYTVTPRAFAAQMSALHRAGFHAIGAARFTALARGKRVSLPSRPLLITFDDGAKGAWVYADPVLRRLSYRAVAFLITGDVSHHQPYYLDWPEVEAMAASGRWSFGSHTFLGHGLIGSGPDRRKGPFLINRRWHPATGRLEAIGRYRTRVAADLDRSIAEIEAHGVPRPRLFAYPFSATVEPTNDPRVVPILERMLRARFSALMDNTDAATLVRPGMRGPLPRLEVLHGMGARTLLDRVADAVARNPEPPPGGGGS